jgi:diguanylate cyclase (GGDEF)-like protein/PAS domain S-box-containing protein
MENKNIDIGIRKHLSNWLYPQALLIWLLITVGFPALYYIIEINQQKRSTNIYAQELSEKFQDVISEAPTRWKYQKDKYKQIISSDLLLRSGVATIEVLDETGRAIADYKHRTQQANKWWNKNAPVGSAPIILNNRKIATVQIRLPQTDILKVTLAFFILSTIVGTSLVFLVYSIPVNFVGQMEGQLQSLIRKIQSSQAQSDRLRVIAQNSEQRFRDLVQGVDAIVWEADAVNYQFTFVSQQAEKLLGYPVEDWLTNADFHRKYIYPDDRLQVANHYLLATSEAKEQVVEYRAIAADGRVLWLRDLVQVVKNKAGMVQLLRGVMTDITKYKHAEEQLQHDAFHDVLTGLPNRALFMHRLGQVVELAKRNQNYLFAVLFLDLDRFKVINDSLGHKVGDQLLIEISRRLEMCIRSCDTVARHGGDEFVILLEDIKNVKDATYVAERIQQELVLPLNLSGHEVFAATSIGITLSTTGYNQPENLLRDADTAMYHAKSLGASRYQVFDTSMHTQAVAMLQLERY